MLKKGKCKHFNGVSNVECEAEIPYKQSGMSALPELTCDLACLSSNNGHFPCPFYEEPSMKELSEQEKRESKRTTAVFSAIKIIRTKHDTSLIHKGFAASMNCPLCEGLLLYHVDGGNHHIHGECQTQDCIKWMM